MNETIPIPVTDDMVSAVMKRMRARVNPRNCARTPEQARAAAQARWANHVKGVKVPRERDGKRFWAKVKRGTAEECWPWTGSKLKTGYGQLRENGKMIRAHRVSWELSRGPIPEGMNVCHHCDNPPCCNPDHLFIGTHLDNTRDKMHKGRYPRSWKNVKVP